MKVTLLILFASIGVFAVFAVPAWDAPTPATAAESDQAPEGTVLSCDVESSRPCLLTIQSGENTRILGGHLAKLDPEHRVKGTFRYWHESAHRSLYVYDEVGNLVTRVVDPKRVLLVDLTE